MVMGGFAVLVLPPVTAMYYLINGQIVIPPLLLRYFPATYIINLQSDIKILKRINKPDVRSINHANYKLLDQIPFTDTNEDNNAFFCTSIYYATTSTIYSPSDMYFPLCYMGCFEVEF